MPGMGGVERNINFRLNCDGWEVCRKENPLLFVNFLERAVTDRIPKISLAPITGAVENIGFKDEEQYYKGIFSAIHKCGIGVCAGDGYPDDKIKYGIKAIKDLQKQDKQAKATFFIKPFETKKILEHIDLCLPYASAVGIDIDSYNISTMKNLVHLEKKTATQLKEVKDYLKARGKPFIIKGIFNTEDIKLVEQVRPDVAYISNHGGRIETRIGSTAEFLQNYAEEIQPHTDKIWVDGGIRSPLDVATAMAFGADRVLIGRPFVSAFCKTGEEGVCKKALEFSLMQTAQVKDLSF